MAPLRVAMRKHFTGRQGAGVAGAAFGEQGGQSHFSEQVESVVAGCTVGAEAHIDAELSHSCDRGNAACQFQVRCRAVRDAAAAVGEQYAVQVIVREVHGVYADEAMGRAGRVSAGVASGAFCPCCARLSARFHGGFRECGSGWAGSFVPRASGCVRRSASETV